MEATKILINERIAKRDSRTRREKRRGKSYPRTTLFPFHVH